MELGSFDGQKGSPDNERLAGALLRSEKTEGEFNQPMFGNVRSSPSGQSKAPDDLGGRKEGHRGSLRKGCCSPRGRDLPLLG